MKQQQNIPLIIEAEGRDQDDRSALCSAFYRQLYRSDRRRVTDRLVFEFVKWIHRTDQRKCGAQFSHHEIAKELLLEVPTARAVVKRAVEEFGLIDVIAEPYVSGGQRANRYCVNWEAVRAINRGCKPGDTRYQAPATTYQPPDTTYQAPATRYQGPATTYHPYKEYNGLSSDSYTDSPPPREGVRDCRTQPQEEEVQKVSLSQNRATALADNSELERLVDRYEAADVYDAREVLAWALPRVGVEYLDRLVEYYDAHRSRWRGAGALRTRLKRSRPSVPIEDAWPPSDTAAVATVAPAKSAEQHAAEREAFRQSRLKAQEAAAQDIPLAEQLRRAIEQQSTGRPS